MNDKERQRDRIERLMARRETLVEAERRTARTGDAPARPVGGIRPRIHNDGLSRQEQLWAEKLRRDN